MRVGAITHAGRMTDIRLSSGDQVHMKVSLDEDEAGSLVLGLLFSLAQINPVKWQALQAEAREVIR